MSKKITLCFFVMLIINQSGIHTASMPTFSAEITDEFRKAVRKRDQEACLAMLNQPETVARIDFNDVNSATGRFLWTDIIQTFGFLTDVALKILELRTEDNGLVFDINSQSLLSKWTPLMCAILCFQPRLVLKILELQQSNGTLLADINVKDDKNASALTDIICRWCYETTKSTALNDMDEKLNCALIIKKLLLFGSDTTNICTGSDLDSLMQNRTPMQRLALCSSQPHEWILPIFDALKPDIDFQNLTMQESMVVQAYQEFLQGKHDELRNQLLVLSDALKKKGLYKDPLVCRLSLIFKPESIKPLLIFLAEKQYQRKIAKDILSVIKR